MISELSILATRLPLVHRSQLGVHWPKACQIRIRAVWDDASIIRLQSSGNAATALRATGAVGAGTGSLRAGRVRGACAVAVEVVFGSLWTAATIGALLNGAGSEAFSTAVTVATSSICDCRAAELAVVAGPGMALGATTGIGGGLNCCVMSRLG